ncbi:hypothetical protein OEA41_002612 [Lepraria neglecta]|uniref:Uncharacterized protein n=1 Tax=Lepraria neglecta TaxID=209136 RepID=A0AAE0DMU0_9LECA|nr:hypothetical protein OEA41_002612 [Lepraria neglecta]
MEVGFAEANVLLALTGDNENFSAQIDFDSMRAQSLPLSRTDMDEGVEAIRVPLVTAVYFIADLQRKEEIVFPELVPNSFERSLYPDVRGLPPDSFTADGFADGVLQLVSQDRIDSVEAAKSAI